MEPFAHPLVQSVLLPAAVAGALLVLGRAGPVPAVAAGAAGAGVLACLLSALGVASWPPRSGLDRLAWLLALAAVAGPLLAALRASPRTVTALRCAFVAAALAWLAWPGLASLSRAELPVVAVLSAGALFIAWRPRGRVAEPACAAAVLGVGALCLAAVSLIASSLILAQLCGALAVVAAILFMFAFGAGDRGCGTALDTAADWGRVCLLLLAALLLLLTTAPAWSLALLAVLCFSDRPLAARVPPRWRPVAAAGAALVPGLAMIAVALWLDGTGADDAYYRG